MPYLVCKKCNGYYEIKEGESPEDFAHCQCGGELKYIETLEELNYYNLSRSNNDEGSKKASSINKTKLGLIGTVMICLVVAGLFYSFSPSSVNSIVYSSNNDHLGDLEVSPASASYVVVGTSYIKVPEDAKVVTQVDRVIRDKLSHVNDNVAPNHSPTSYKELVPWMEGKRLGELMKYANVTVIPASGVPVKKIKGGYFGPDDKGNFKFEVDPSKISPVYSTKNSNDTWTEIDTHGMNVMVPEAVKNNAYLVVACGDLKGKAQAEAYMAKKGINCYAPCDRFTSTVMPYEGPGVILGGEPIRQLKDGSGAVIGAQPLYFSTKETIVVQTTTKRYPDQYCDTPFRFFTNLQKAYNITLNVDVVDASVGETDKVIAEARKIGANVIGVRVLNMKDKKPVEEWLKENKNHKAILFHSAAYEPGYSLFFEFPYQVTGQDPNPKFIKYASDSEIQNRFNSVRSLWQ